MREELAPRLSRLRAPNPGPLTGSGTNTYVLGAGPYVVIDPGPDLDAHLEAILADTSGDIAAILVTHSHLDHTALVPRLKAACGAPVLGFGPSGAGQSAVMAGLSDLGGAEGADTDFTPDQRVTEGQVVTFAGETLIVHHTPGHFGNHICLAWEDALFSGDHVMGWATTLVSPPHGDLTDFMVSCEALAALPARCYYPGHGDPIEDGPDRVRDLIAHRRAREAQIRSVLVEGPATAREITERVYTDVSPALWPAAERNVLAHLIDLCTRKIARPDGPLTARATFRTR